MRRSFRSWTLLAPIALAAACSPESPTAPSPKGPSLSVGGGGCAYAYVTSGVLQPINADNSSVFNLGRTIPVKIRVTDCVTGAAANGLAPQLSLGYTGSGGGTVNELVSSSAADEGTIMRSAGDGQYIYNLSTKNSQFNAGLDLVVGSYQLTISSPDFAEVMVTFVLR